MAKFSRASLCLALIAAMLWCTMAETNSLDIEKDGRQLLTENPRPVVPIVPRPVVVRPVPVVVVKPEITTGSNKNNQTNDGKGFNQNAQNSGIGKNSDQGNINSGNVGRKLLEVVRPNRPVPVRPVRPVVVVQPEINTGANVNNQANNGQGFNQNSQNSGVGDNSGQGNFNSGNVGR